MTKDITPQEAQAGGQGGIDPSHPDLQISHAARKAEDQKLAPMSNGGLSNEEISLLCDIGEGKAVDCGPSAPIARLKAEGYITAAARPTPELSYELTNKAQDFLSERSAGLNEA